MDYKGSYSNFNLSGLERDPKEKYGRFVKEATKRFLDSFKHNYPSSATEINKKNRWVITDKKMWLFRNIFIMSLEDSIDKENLSTVIEEYQKTIEELKEIIKVAKHDLEYISDEVKKKVDEEFEYG